MGRSRRKKEEEAAKEKWGLKDANTPEHFWSTLPYDTPELYDQGLINVGTPFSPEFERVLKENSSKDSETPRYTFRKRISKGIGSLHANTSPDREERKKNYYNGEDLDETPSAKNVGGPFLSNNSDVLHPQIQNDDDNVEGGQNLRADMKITSHLTKGRAFSSDALRKADGHYQYGTPKSSIFSSPSSSSTINLNRKPDEERASKIKEQRTGTRKDTLLEAIVRKGKNGTENPNSYNGLEEEVKTDWEMSNFRLNAKLPTKNLKKSGHKLQDAKETAEANSSKAKRIKKDDDQMVENSDDDFKPSKTPSRQKETKGICLSPNNNHAEMATQYKYKKKNEQGKRGDQLRSFPQFSRKIESQDNIPYYDLSSDESFNDSKEDAAIIDLTTVPQRDNKATPENDDDFRPKKRAKLLSNINVSSSSSFISSNLQQHKPTQQVPMPGNKSGNRKKLDLSVGFGRKKDTDGRLNCDKEQKYVPCWDCNGEMIKETEITRHYWNLHAFDAECPFCKDRLTSYINIKRHVESHHKREIGLHDAKATLTQRRGGALLEKMLQVVRVPINSQVLQREQFIIAYDSNKNRQCFVFEELYPDMIMTKTDSDAYIYEEDDNLPDKQVTPEAIKYVGYGNGHLAAARNHRNSKNAISETFLMSNIVAMRRRLNDGRWKSLESFVRTLATKWSSVLVVTGPIFDNELNPPIETIGGVDVQIPTKFFKFVRMERPGEEPKHLAFIMLNIDYELVSSIFKDLVSIEDLEKETGLCFSGSNEQKRTSDIFSPINKITVHYISKSEQCNGDANHNFQCVKKDCKFTAAAPRDVQRHCKEEHEELRVIPCWTCGGKLFEHNQLRDHHYEYHAFESKCPFCDRQVAKFGFVHHHLARAHKREMGLHEAIKKLEPPSKKGSLVERLPQLVQIPENNEVIIRDQYLVVFNKAQKRQSFVFECLNPEMMESIEKEKLDRRIFTYKLDPDLPPKQVTPQAIQFLGYENGHLANCKNHMNSAKPASQTFFMSNITPMKRRVNVGLVLSMEGHVRNLASKWSSVIVITGPIFNEKKLPSKPAPGGLAVQIPTHFFKVIIMERAGEQALMQAFVIPNDNYKTTRSFFSYRTTLQDLETRTGLKFLIPNGIQMSWDISPDLLVFPCKFPNCNLTFMDKTQFDQHKLEHQQSNSCKNCGKLCDSQELLVEHRNAMHLRKCTFDGCDSIFYSKHELDDHVIRHHIDNNSRPFTCDHLNCGKSFTTYSGLHIHKYIHGRKDAFPCPVVTCSMSFATKARLKNHVSHMHTDDKPHKCTHPGCTKSFTLPSELKRHQLSHCDDKPYKCDHQNCKKAFKIKYKLTEHKLVHSDIKPFICKECGKGFKSKGALKDHAAFHSDEPMPFICPIPNCGKGFPRKAWLDQHLRRKDHQ